MIKSNIIIEVKLYIVSYQLIVKKKTRSECMVLVKIFSNYRPMFEANEFILEVSTVLEAIEELDKISGGVFKKEILEKDGVTLVPRNIVLVNGRKVNFLDGVHTKVTSEDRLSIFPPTGGG